MARKTHKAFAAATAAAVLVLMLLASDAAAQTDRRRQSARPTPTPTPVNRDPAVISRADDYPTVVIEPVPVDNDAADAGSSETIAELRERIRQLERRNRRDPDEKQRRLSLNLDILTKSEQRADTLRKQLFEMIEKENTIRGRMDQIDNDMSPESIERNMATVGSLRPEELRNQRRRSFELEKTNLQSLLTEVQKTRANLEMSLVRADDLVERLRARIEKEIDTALAEDEASANDPNP